MTVNAIEPQLAFSVARLVELMVLSPICFPTCFFDGSRGPRLIHCLESYECAVHSECLIQLGNTNCKHPLRKASLHFAQFAALSPSVMCQMYFWHRTRL